jgi:hypothetical protein
VRLNPLGMSANIWLFVPALDDRWWWVWSSWWNENWQGKPKHSEKTCPNATLFTTNPAWPDPGSNPGRRGGKPATNRLSCGMAQNDTNSEWSSKASRNGLQCYTEILKHHCFPSLRKRKALNHPNPKPLPQAFWKPISWP